MVVDQLKKVRREVTMLMKEDSRVIEFFQKICELEKVLESGWRILKYLEFDFIFVRGIIPSCVP